jgi:hypothetical protein
VNADEFIRSAGWGGGETQPKQTKKRERQETSLQEIFLHRIPPKTASRLRAYNFLAPHLRKPMQLLPLLSPAVQTQMVFSCQWMLPQAFETQSG